MTDGADWGTRAREELLAMAINASRMIRVILDVILQGRSERVTAITVGAIGPVIFNVIVVVQKERVVNAATPRRLLSAPAGARRAPATLLLGCWAAVRNRRRMRINKHDADEQGEDSQRYNVASRLMTIRLSLPHCDCFPLASESKARTTGSLRRRAREGQSSSVCSLDLLSFCVWAENDADFHARPDLDLFL